MRILLAEDERSLSRAIIALLEKHNYSADAVYDGQEALDYLEGAEYDAIVLDVMMPRMDGITMMMKVREKGYDFPVIMLSAKSEEVDKIMGLNMGADDYITKPFGIMELLSRIKAVLRRSHTVQKAESHVLSAHDLTIDLDQRTVVYLETEIVLTYKEFELLSYLVRNRGTAISRDRLLEQVWGFSYEGETRTVDAHVKTLRQKLDAAGCSNLIHTVRGYGYKIGG